MQESVVSVVPASIKNNEPFHIMEQGVRAHAPRAQLACGELCAEAVREEAIQQKRVS